MVAEGKLFVAINKGEQVPSGWIIDKHGKPTNEPRDFYDGGALLTVGAHKGSGMSIIVDLLAGAISTGKSSDPDDTVLRNNMLALYIAPAVYDSTERSQAKSRVCRGSRRPPAVTVSRYCFPAKSARHPRAPSCAGIAIDDQTWKDLAAAAATVGHWRRVGDGDDVERGA
jgi:uncharacterized oxidoreductase